MCQVGAAGGGMPPVQQAPAKVGGVDGGGMPPAKVAGTAGGGMPPGKVEQVPTTGGGHAAHAGAAGLGGGSGDLASVLANLVAALKSVVASLGNAGSSGEVPPDIGFVPPASPPLTAAQQRYGQRVEEILERLGRAPAGPVRTEAMTASGRAVTVERRTHERGESIVLSAGTGQPEQVTLDGKTLSFDRDGFQT